MHICCSPCAILPVLRLSNSYEITGLFFNPNIHPYKEYLDRKKSVMELSREHSIKIIEDDYPYQEFLNRTLDKATQEDRCTVCYQIRLLRLKKQADNLGFDTVTTSLLYSIYQKHDLLLSIASKMFEENRFLSIDYRKDFWSGVEEAKQRNYYLQKYCGCIFSNFERYHAIK
jgi:predicted adenine nucleotide alpha hydrolase (AANH) superfamily ATPase